MGLQEALYPSSPPGYELDLKASTRSSKISGGLLDTYPTPPPPPEPKYPTPLTHPHPPPLGGGGAQPQGGGGVIYLTLWYINPAMMI